jgi:hypothetical protein
VVQTAREQGEISRTEHCHSLTHFHARG